MRRSDPGSWSSTKRRQFWKALASMLVTESGILASSDVGRRAHGKRRLCVWQVAGTRGVGGASQEEEEEEEEDEES